MHKLINFSLTMKELVGQMYFRAIHQVGCTQAIKGTVVQMEKVLIKDRMGVSKVS